MRTENPTGLMYLREAAFFSGSIAHFRNYRRAEISNFLETKGTHVTRKKLPTAR